MGDNDDATILLTDIQAALNSAESEASTKPASLLIVGGELNGTIFDLNQSEITIGRSADNTIPLEFNGISRCHFKIINENEDKHIIMDNESRNGTFLNDQKLEKNTVLKKGDSVKIGSIHFKYLPKGDPERLTYDKLQLEANTDSLTQSFNKGYFNKKLDILVKKSKITGRPLSLILFDLDHFKKLNDNYGHDAGDYVLKEMASIIKHSKLRQNDIFARYGGEEFVIILSDTNIKQGFEIAERIRKLIEDHTFSYDDKKLPVTASIGIADYRKGVLTATDLFKRADEAVYVSKEKGRNQVNFYRAK